MRKSTPTTEVTMREFRAAPAKVLRRAARAGARLRIGNLVLTVEATTERGDRTVLHGCMRSSGRIVGRPGELLSAHDHWATDA
jgi:hypothetical protein